MSALLDTLLVAVAIATVGGAVVAVSARVPRLAVLGALVALLGAPFVADPVPSVLAVAARLAGGVLAAYLVWIALRGVPGTGARGTRLGWPAEAAVACAAFVGGWLLASSLGAGVGGQDGAGSGAAAAAAIGAATALATLAAGPVLLARDGLRFGLGLLLLLNAASMLGAGAGGPRAADDTLLDLVAVGYALGVAATGAAVAWLIDRSVTDRGTLDLTEELRGTRAAATPPAGIRLSERRDEEETNRWIVPLPAASGADGEDGGSPRAAAARTGSAEG